MQLYPYSNTKSSWFDETGDSAMKNEKEAENYSYGIALLSIYSILLL